MAQFDIQGTRARLAADLMAGKITRAAHDNYLAIAEFCVRQRTYQILTQVPISRTHARSGRDRMDGNPSGSCRSVSAPGKTGGPGSSISRE